MKLNEDNCGPTLRISKELHAMKYRGEGESFLEAQVRFANALKDSPEHFKALKKILVDQRFMGGGRTQAAIGAPRKVTAFNCFVSGTMEDSFDHIMKTYTEAGKTMRLGGGNGYDFSPLRPKGDLIVKLESRSSGPVSFMSIGDAICGTISAAGHRRGAQMAVLRVDHPDIEEFVTAKHNRDQLTRFNTSIGITDEFMEAVVNREEFALRFNGRIYEYVDAYTLWEKIMRSTWEWAEPGVLFLDVINNMNNLKYCETIAATNPCGEQPLPPYGACLLGSFNMIKYVNSGGFDYEQFRRDIRVVVRAMDNIIDRTIYPLPEQEQEAKNKRRMGLGMTAVANAGEVLGYSYGSKEFIKWFEEVAIILRLYWGSVELAEEKGSFPLFDADKFCDSNFVKTLPDDLQQAIRERGIRNSHLISYAPTGTISLTADNVSGGIEPVFSHYYDRTVQTFDGPIVERVEDYAYRVYGVAGKKATECTPEEHLSVLATASKYCDSAVSKTINCDPNMDWEDFKNIYLTAWQTGCKGVTTFNPGGSRFGILNEVVEENEQEEPANEACYINTETGQKECA